MIDKPSEKEDQYFKEQEIKKLKKLEGEAQARKQETEAQRQKELHWMRCPKCGQELKEIIHEELALDKCESCEGIWLDKGELDLLINLEADKRATFFSTVRKIFG